MSKAYQTFSGKQYTLYSSGTSEKVSGYIKQYGIPKNALHEIVNIEKECRLYLHFKK
jgi:hypothetical protein